MSRKPVAGWREEAPGRWRLPDPNSGSPDAVLILVRQTPVIRTWACETASHYWQIASDDPPLLAAEDRAVADIDATRAVLRPLTVGEALGRPEVQSGAMVVEYSGAHDGAAGRQTRINAGLIESRWFDGGRWHRWHDKPDRALDGSDIVKPCRLVPATDADRDPGERP